MSDTIRPQPGPQEAFLASPADIAIYGGAAGGGKTWALLMEALRHIHRPEFSAVIFRRKSTHVRNAGGLWDQSARLYPALGGGGRTSLSEWRFPAGARVRFAHLEREDTVYDWQGAQIPLLGFDELTHFSADQFWYMFSRNRSTCGVRPYVRATTNPDADSWVAGLLDWWIGDDGFPVPERAGKLRWFVRRGGDLLFGDEPAELPEPEDARSLAFIPATLADNQALLEADPAYPATLKALPEVARARLLDGNWRIRPAAGTVFKASAFALQLHSPAQGRRVRRWDLAASTGKNGDWTVGVRMVRTPQDRFVIEDVVRLKGSPHEVEKVITATAAADGRAVEIGLPRDPGQAGKAQISWLSGKLAGYVIHSERESGDKVTRAAPLAAQVEAGNVALLRGGWNAAFLREAEGFPDGGHDDQVDAAAGAFSLLTEQDRVRQIPLHGI